MAVNEEKNSKTTNKLVKFIKDFFSSKTFIIYTMLVVLISIFLLVKGDSYDFSFVIYMIIFCYFTVLFVIILPIWAIERASNSAQDEQELKKNENNDDESIKMEYQKKCNESSKIVNDIVNEEERKQIANKIIAFIIVAILFCGFMLYRQNENKKREILVDKRAMLNMIQEYSSDIITVNDFDVEEIEKNDIYTIYEVTVNQSNYYISGPFYVALVKNGGISTDYVLLNKNLYDLRSNL